MITICLSFFIRLVKKKGVFIENDTKLDNRNQEKIQKLYQ